MLFVLFISTVNPVCASPTKLANGAQIDLVITSNESPELTLEVVQMPLSKVLDAIAVKSHISIHYSVLPEGLVTATCAGSTLKQVLECLLNKKTNFIMNYTHRNNPINQKEQASEIWILGSNFERTRNNEECAVKQSVVNNGRLTSQENSITENSEANQTESLLIMTQSKNASERTSAMGSLLAEGRVGDPHVKAVLEQGLTDPDANVRAQAISSLAHREGNAVLPAIQEALRDPSADVRLMAVDGITDDVALLQQAINDNDEAVRNLAKLKLDALIHAK
jgi:HEAT repeats